jgi:HEAT repeat protein
MGCSGRIRPDDQAVERKGSAGGVPWNVLLGTTALQVTTWVGMVVRTKILTSWDAARSAYMNKAPELVRSFTDSTVRFETYQSLVALGDGAIPALREGLRSDDWQVRRWSAICLDRIADTDALQDLVPLLRDPKAAVRLWAVHSLACDHCKDDVECPVDVVPMLIERIDEDPSLRVRRMAVIMLGSEFVDRRAIPVFERILSEEQDRKLRLHAVHGLERLGRSAG